TGEQEHAYEKRGSRQLTPPETQQHAAEHTSSRRSSRRLSKNLPDTNCGQYTDEKAAVGGERHGKRRSRGSIEDITALPGMKELQTSPHLRPADMHRPAIPYELPHHKREGITYDKPRERQSLGASRRSTQDSTPRRKLSSRRKEQHIREEEIRALSAPVPIPKRPAGHTGDVLRRDSKKAKRGLSKSSDPRGSNVSLPMEGSIHSSMSAKSDQRGWAVSSFDVFNPRPTIRYSGSAQYPGSRSFTEIPSLTPRSSRKNKMPAVPEQPPKHVRRIADLADDLDAAELREVMERDRRRRDKKRAAEQEKLERKLRKRADKQNLEALQRAEEERRAQEDMDVTPVVPAPPTAIHPAFRERSGTDDEPITPMSLKNERFLTPMEELPPQTGTYLDYRRQPEATPDPFEDPRPAPNPFADPEAGPSSPVRGLGLYSPVETPMEDPIVETAKEVRLSQASISPPRSPITNHRAGTSLSQLANELQRERTPEVLQPPSPLKERRASETSAASASRAGTWAALFRRGGPTLKRASEIEGARSSQSDFSFSNTSRESMGRQPLPAHLVQQPAQRRSGTPVRTQSKFREDLPELPLSPPDSRVQSPDVTLAAATVAAARRGRKSPENTDFPPAASAVARHSIPAVGRTDSPVSRTSEALMSASMASVDSEGSWLTGRPSKRVSQSPPKVVQQQPSREDFSASYEDLGMPEDEYFRRLTPNPEAQAHSQLGAQESHVLETPANEYERTFRGEPAVAGASAQAPGEQLHHGTAHRKPTIVHRGQVKSREGLLAEYEAGEIAEEASFRSATSEYSAEEGEKVPESRVQKATSVNYGTEKGHARQLSAGSAKLLDIPRRRESQSPGTPRLGGQDEGLE
ncbi:hypothetical protein M8818_001113, partial [Zalaria obscura]